MNDERRRVMRRIGLVGLLLGGLALGGVGAIAYQMGMTAGASQAAVSAGATVVYAAPWGAGVGFFPIVGLFFFGLLFLAIVGGFARRAAWARAGRPGGPGFGPGFGPGHGPWMHGGWSPSADRPVPPPFDEALGRWHERAHGTAPAGSTGSGSTDQAGPSGPDSTGPA
jgi:hypothetical protein